MASASSSVFLLQAIILTDKERSSPKEIQQQYHLCHFHCSGGLRLPCCSIESAVCRWCMWRVSLPKWINTITSSRWLQHLVPLSVIVLMLYWLLLSREPNLCAVLFIPSTHAHANMHTHTYYPLPHTSTIPTLLCPWTHNPFFMELWNDYATSWLDTPFHPVNSGRMVRLEEWDMDTI